MGRKTVITKEIISNLLEGFCMGYKIPLACMYAGVSRQTFYNYCKKKEGFLENPDFVFWRISKRCILRIRFLYCETLSLFILEIGIGGSTIDIGSTGLREFF